MNVQSISYSVTCHYQGHFQNKILQLIFNFCQNSKDAGLVPHELNLLYDYKHLLDKPRLSLGPIFQVKLYGNKKEII